MRTFLLWAPRIAGLALTLFVASFALGALTETHSLVGTIMHLAPTIIAVGIVAIGWRRPLVGGLGMTILAVLYAVTTRRADWILAISGPLALTGLLYFASWRATRSNALT